MKMKKITIVFLSLLVLKVFGQPENLAIKKANEYVADKKYETAYHLLDSIDPSNDKPEVVLLKEDILLNYFVTSMMHRIFSLTNIKKEEDIRDYRGKEGTYNMHLFDVDSILTRLIKINPTNCKLYKGLGDYYYDVHLKYGENWIIGKQEQLEIIETNFKRAVDGGCADFLTLYVLGYANLVQEKNKESIPYFLKSIELNHDYASSHYNLAYAYLLEEDRVNSLKYAKNALDLYNDVQYKSDAARMMGLVYFELKDDTNALKYYELADKIDPNNYDNIKPILNLYVKTNNKKAKELTAVFLNIAPANPTIYNALEEIYSGNNKIENLVEFYKSQLPNFKDDQKVLGNLNFYLAKIYLNIDKKLAKEYFVKTRTIFKKVFDKDHAVFSVIETGIEQCK